MRGIEQIPWLYDGLMSLQDRLGLRRWRRWLAGGAGGRVLAPGGSLRMMEHVRSRRRLVAKLQDLGQPVWTRVQGGCHPNRDTEASVEAAGFAIQAEGRRERGVMRRFTARAL